MNQEDWDHRYPKEDRNNTRGAFSRILKISKRERFEVGVRGGSELGIEKQRILKGQVIQGPSPVWWEKKRKKR